MDNKMPKGVHKLAALSFAVISAASLSGCNMPESASILIPKPAEFIPALIAFLVIWFLLAKYAWPTITKTLDDRQAKIQEDLDAAERTRAELEKEKHEYATRVDQAQREAGEIVAEAKKDAESVRSEVLAKAQKEASSIIAKSHEALEGERRKAMIELSGSVVDLSVEIAGKIIGNELSEDQQRALAEKYLAEVGKTNDKE
ncbi:F0F1 ATP synthase subunit B [uncultured Olegusella sp.]|uniref:F0F1 ATP synthase subunit B n=1 Tax=uncultured Olegusella sp. TaxID=1979846 RepID=UPI002617BBCC|nr:F0F1 ATP synthase subunit B [uncultured Olegusella sp.]